MTQLSLLVQRSLTPIALITPITPTDSNSWAFALASLPTLLDIAAKSVLILALAGLATLTMRRSSAAARHLVWLLGTCSLLILPLLCAALPGWHILPQWSANANSPEAPLAAHRQSQISNFKPPISDLPSPISDFQSPISDPIDSRITPLTPTDAHPRAFVGHLPWQGWILLAWTCGTLVLMAQIMLGALSLRWLEYRSKRIMEGEWAELLREARERLGLRRPVVLLSSPRRTMPMTWGLWRTRVLLPLGARPSSAASSSPCTPDQLRTVLLHELAHAKRWDCLTQLLVQIAYALYWFNPLVWLAWHRIQTERERACDDLVLNSGTKASAYAEQLLHIASEMPPIRHSAAAIAMARPSKLEGRLLAILDTTRNRRTVTCVAVVLGIAVLSGVVVPLAMLRAGASTTQSAEKSEKRIIELIYVLRHSTLDSREDEWCAAIMELAEIGKPAVSSLVRELDRSDGIFEKSAIAFTLRAIGDPRAVPALIRALPRSAGQIGSFGITLANEDVQRFMVRYAAGQGPSSAFLFNWPLDEEVRSLEWLTGHSEGNVDAKSDAPADQEEAAKVRREIADRWMKWWTANRRKYISDAELATVENQTIPPGDPVEAAGLANAGPMFPAGPDVRLGPVHDLVLPVQATVNTKAYLDFDTGRLFSEFEGGRRNSDRDYPRWMQAMGIDATAQDNTLRGYDIHAWHVRNNLWDTLPGDLAKQSMIEPGREGPSSDFYPRRSDGGALMAPDGLPATFLFTTREGGRGILQMLSQDARPQGFHIRYRMFESPRLQIVKATTLPAPTAAAGQSFGPRHEVTLHDPRGNMDAALDFDTGKTYAMPAGAYDAGYEKWLDASDASVMALPDSKHEILAAIRGTKVSLQAVAPDGWDHLTPAEVLDLAGRFPPSRDYLEALAIFPSLPQTAIFRTSKGTVGLLQITEANGVTGVTSHMELVPSHPMTLKLRYKIVQSVQSATHPAATHPAAHTVALHLVTNPAEIAKAEKTPLSELQWDNTPLLTASDIREYDWTTHTIHLKPGIAGRILNRKGLSEPFVLAVDGKSVYLGSLQSVISSYLPKEPVINVGPSAGEFQPADAIRIDPPPIAGTPDPRNAEPLKTALHDLKLLKDFPATQSSLPEMTPRGNSNLGLTFNCPTNWVDVTKEDGMVDHPRRLLLAEPPPWRDGVRAQVEVTVEDVGGARAQLDLSAKPNPAATISTITAIDGIPARITGYRLPNSPGEMVTLQMAKDSRFYTVTMVIPSQRREYYLALCDAVFNSVRIVGSDAATVAARPAATQPATPALGERSHVRG